MIINTQSMVPKVYNSRDYQVLLSMLDLVVNSAKLYTDSFTDLINPDKCPDRFLPLLAGYVGYRYDNNVSCNTNRQIIKYYSYLIRNRGSFTGLRLAASLSHRLAETDNREIDPLSVFNVTYDGTTNMITVSVYDPGSLVKIRDLLEVVRPAGVGIRVVLTVPVHASDKLHASDSITMKPGHDTIGFIGTGIYTEYTEGMDEYLNQVPYDSKDGSTIDEFNDPHREEREYSAIIGTSTINELEEDE